MNSRFNFTMTSRNISSLGWSILLALLWVKSASADVCVWRDPDKTMSKLFPEARDYVTITKKLTQEIVASIEKQLGTKLDDSEKAEFNFYDLRALKDGKPTSVGTAMALAGKGEFGAIEVVIGVDLQGKIRAVYIQRSREKASKALKSDAFLKQFTRKSVADPLEFGKDIKGLPEAPKAAEVVRLTIKKMLLFQKELANAPDHTD